MSWHVKCIVRTQIPSYPAPVRSCPDQHSSKVVILLNVAHVSLSGRTHIDARFPGLERTVLYRHNINICDVLFTNLKASPHHPRSAKSFTTAHLALAYQP